MTNVTTDARESGGAPSWSIADARLHRLAYSTGTRTAGLVTERSLRINGGAASDRLPDVSLASRNERKTPERACVRLPRRVAQQVQTLHFPTKGEKPMKTHPQQAVDLPDSPPTRRAGQYVSAALVAVLAAVMLSTTAAVANTKYRDVNVPVGIVVSLGPEGIHSSLGYTPTNPRFTSVTFATTDYYDDSVTGLLGKNIVVKTKTAAELNAMANPPSNPFTVKADATWTDDTGKTMDWVISFKTVWPKAPPPVPTLSVTTQHAAPGSMASGWASYFFSNAGAGAKLTDVSFSTMEYYNADRTGLFGTFLDVTAKSSEELSAMDPPPPNPFTVQVTLTMTNNAGQTVTGTVDYITNY